MGGWVKIREELGGWVRTREKLGEWVRTREKLGGWVRTREEAGAAYTSVSAALTGNWGTGGRRSRGPPR